MTLISYKEAAEILGINHGSLQHALSGGRAALTKPPRIGTSQPLIKEQVELFKGKRLSLNSLKGDDLKKWHELAATVEPRIESPVQVPVQAPVLDPDLFVQALLRHGASINVQSSFQSPPVEQDDKQAESMSFDFMLIWFILLGIAYLLSKKSNESTKQAKQTLDQLGIEREELEDSQREKAVAKLRGHNQEINKLKTILKKELVFPQSA